MSLRIIQVQQGTDEWHSARAGMATASEFQTVLAEGRTKGSPSVTRAKYMRKLAAERITGRCIEGYTNQYTERGHEVEPEARAWYSMCMDCDVEQVGFVVNDLYSAGCSPDGLIGQEGMVELKSRRGDLQIELLEDDKVPTEHFAQIQGCLWITGRKWIDFVSYCAGLPVFCRRVHPDLEYHQRLQREVAKFNAELSMLVQRISG